MSYNEPPGLGFPPRLLALLRELQPGRYLYLTWTPYTAGRPGGPRRGRLNYSEGLADSAVPALLATCVGLGFTGWGSLRCVERVSSDAGDGQAGQHKGSETFWLYFDKPDPGEAPKPSNDGDFSLSDIMEFMGNLKMMQAAGAGFAGAPPNQTPPSSEGTAPNSSQAQSSKVEWE